MATKNLSVFGVYTSRENAENAVDRLVAEQFNQEQISLLLQDSVGCNDVTRERQSMLPEGAATKGAVAGGVIGGALGLLAHIGVLAIPGLGPLVVVGPIIAALTGIGSGGMLGGIIGGLVGLGVPEYQAKQYEGRIRAGGILLSVRCDSQADLCKAKNVLGQTGADDVASSMECASDIISSHSAAT